MDERYDSTRDLARELRTWSLYVSEAGIVTGSGRVAGQGQKSWRSLPGFVAAALAVLFALTGAFVTGAFVKGTARPPPPVTRLEIRLPQGHYLTLARQPFAISPDGKLLVYSAFTWKKPFEEEEEPKLFLRPLDSFEAQPIPGTGGGIQPVFSPDGRNIAFSVLSEKKDFSTFVKRVPVAGGPAMTICECLALFGTAWSPDGSILFGSQTGPLQKVPDTGGAPEPATVLDAGEGEISHRLPHLLPDGRTVLYTAVRWRVVGMSWTSARIFAQRLGDKERSLLAEGGSDGRWVPPGDLLFARQGKLFAAPFDVKTLRLGGRSVPILEGVSHSIWTPHSTVETGAAMSDLAAGRVFAWIPGSVTPEYQASLVWLDASAKETPIDLPKGPILSGRVSPDGERLLVQYNYPGRQAEVLELTSGARHNVTFDMNPLWAIWGPGPDRITFTSDHEGPMRLYSRRINAGSEDVETLWKGRRMNGLGLGSWSPDGKTLAFVVFDEKTGFDVWLLGRGKEPRPFLASSFNEFHPDISPDGRWLLYVSDEPGRVEVFVRQLSDEGSARQISVGGGFEPLWSRDGSAIFYWGTPTPTNDRRVLFRVRVSPAGEGPKFGHPERLLEAPHGGSQPGHGWDVAPDGRFLLSKPPNEADRRAYLEKILSGRIRVDVGGFPALLAEVGKGR